MSWRPLLCLLWSVSLAPSGALASWPDPILHTVSLRLRTAPALSARPAWVAEGAEDALWLRGAAADWAIDWRDPGAVEGLLRGVIVATRAAEPDHGAELLAVYTAGPVDRAPFYLPLANDVRGLGYGHLGLAPGETFRSGVDPRLDGVAFLGDLPSALADPARARALFLHEVGHRWGAYVHVAGEGPADAALGRACSHWSYFLHSEGSALEGNRWIAAGPGRWAPQPVDAPGYSDLDRYLMGFLPAAAVAPAWRLAVPTAPCAEPARGGVANPAWQGPVGAEGGPIVEAEAIEVTAAQVQAAEGPRVPAWPDSPQRWTVRFVVLLGPQDAAPGPAMAGLRRGLTAAWMAAAGSPRGSQPVLATARGGRADVPVPGVDADGGPPDGGLADGGPRDAGPDAAATDAAVPDAAAPDAARTDEAGLPDEGTPALRDGGGGGGAGSGGCATTPAPGGPAGWGVLCLLAAGLRRRRRRGPGCGRGCRPASRAAPPARPAGPSPWRPRPRARG